MLQFIKNCLSDKSYNKKISDNPSIVKIIKNLRKNLYTHYTFMDIEKGGKRCHHRLRYYLLYLDPNNTSFEAIADETYIDIVTLKYYVKLYNKTALEYVIEESNMNIDYAVLLKEYLKSGL